MTVPTLRTMVRDDWDEVAELIHVSRRGGSVLTNGTESSRASEQPVSQVSSSRPSCRRPLDRRKMAVFPKFLHIACAGQTGLLSLDARYLTRCGQSARRFCFDPEMSLCDALC